MNLSIDLGNTYAKTGLFEGSKLTETNWKLTYPELINYVKTVRPQMIMVSSVSYSEEQLRTEFADIADEIYLLKSTTPVPLQKLYDTPETLGADRVAAAIGAKVLYPEKNCIVIDMGTCITYDLVDSADNFHGGIISPGVRMRFKAMNTFTKRLPLLEPDGIPELIGKSTKHAMQSGVMNGILSEINGFVDEYGKVLTNINVIFCGGDATYFANRIKNPNFVIPELVLIGLNRILEYNVKNHNNTEV
ncbi:MAG: type III pantothenate kinase [Arcicella sp.]|nr:type III pantothenate kinase [Arcicella sp.]